MLDHALNYAARGWRVFPVHNAPGGVCSCGRAPCGKDNKNAGKHPRTPNGVKDATTDPATIRWWWGMWPDANIAIATGSGAIVVDTDNAEQIAQFRDLATANGGMGESAISRTGRGAHFWFAGHFQGSCTIDGLLYRGEGGYVIVPPSVHANGNVYQWVRDVPLAKMPAWLTAYIDAYQQRADNPQVAMSTALSQLGAPPPWIEARGAQRLQGVNGHASLRLADQNVGTPYTPDELARIESALAAISPSSPREPWLRVGMALHSLDWITSSGDDLGFALWDRWSSGSPEKYNPHDCVVVWRSFRRSGVTIGTLFHLAEQCGWSGVPMVPPVHESGTFYEPSQVPGSYANGATHLPAGLGQPTYQPSNPIDLLNTTYSVIGDVGGRCLVLGWIPSHADGTSSIPSFQTFKSFAERFGNQYVQVQNPKTGEVEMKQLGALWLKHTRRKTYDRLDLVPGAGPIVAPNTLNLWRGFGVEPRPGSWELMKYHIGSVVADGEAESIQYILKWAAWAVQHPAERAEVALVLRGGKGTGKGTFGHALRRIFGQHGLHVANSKHLVGSFNAHLRNCLLLFADEAFWAGDKQGESTLKAMLTEPTIPIEQKGVDVVEWANRLHVIMAANAEWVVPASHDERRYAVFEVSDTHRGDRNYWRALHEEMNNGGLAAMLHDLLNVQLGDWHPRDVVETDALDDQKQRSMNPLQEWWQSIIEVGAIPFMHGSEGVHRAAAVMLLNHAKEFSNRLKDTNPTQFGRFLRSQGCIKYRVAGHIEWRFPTLAEARNRWRNMYGVEFDELQQWQGK